MKKIAVPVISGLIGVVFLHQGALGAAPKPAPSPTPQLRTYVSGLGSDANPCTVGSPCQTFQRALAMTVAGGAVFVRDSANYGPATITKAVTITSEGAMAGVLASSGVGITINANPADVVTLRGLDIDGGNSGSIGIQFNSGRSLNIQKSLVHNFSNSGIVFSPTGAGGLFISDATVSNNTNNGILVAGGASGATGAFSRVNASANGVGVFASGSNVSLALTDSIASSNNYGIGASLAAVTVRNSTASNNAVGISADQNAMVRVGQSTVTGNGTGWQATNGGQILSYGNNTVGGNQTDGAATTTVTLE